MEETRSYFDTDYCFVANYGEPLRADHFRKRLLQHACEAGIDVKKTPVTPHRLRDYFFTQYLLNGGDLFTLQRIVAHADIKTTQGYVKPSEMSIRNSHEQFSPLSRVGQRRKKYRKKFIFNNNYSHALTNSEKSFQKSKLSFLGRVYLNMRLHQKVNI